MNTTHEGILCLLRSGITGEPGQLPEDFSLEDAFPLLRRQSVVPLAYQGAVLCGMAKDGPAMNQMLMISFRNLMTHERQTSAVEGLFRAFEEQGVCYTPVKGCNMKKLYPKPELRAMGDADILIHPKDHEKIREIMLPLGFAFCGENDHVFEWHSNDLHVELHKSLVPPVDEDYYSYYGTGWQLAVQSDGCRYDLSPEDSYLFLLTHFARHYRSGGIGCRHVVDLFVYRNAHPHMDETYLARELEKLRLTDFHFNVLSLLDVWFRGKTPGMIDELMTSFIFSGGNWGTMEAGMLSEEVKKAKRSGRIGATKRKMILHAIFPSRQSLSYRYGLIRKYPVLLPVIWVVRWVDILLFRPQKIRKRLSIIESVKDDKLLSHKQALCAVGLDFYFE